MHCIKTFKVHFYILFLAIIIRKANFSSLIDKKENMYTKSNDIWKKVKTIYNKFIKHDKI